MHQYLDEQLESPILDLTQLNSDLSSVLRMVPIPFLILDGDGRIRRFTPEAAKLLRLSAEDRGQLVDQLRLGLDFPDLNELISPVVGRARSLQREIRAYDSRWYSMRLGPHVTAEGKIDGVLIAFVDIHELKQGQDVLKSESEATVRALLETAAQAILAVNGDGRIVLVNAAAEGMFGYSRQELLDLKLERLIPERLRERHAQEHACWRLQPQNRPMGAGRDLVALRKDGSEFPVEIGLSHIKTNGDMLGVAFISDITDRKRNAAAVLQYQGKLQELTARLLSVQEAETKLLARELHDVFSQKLAALGMHISALLKTGGDSPGTLPRRLKALGQQVHDLAEEIHRMSRQLHPAILDDLGLEAALREECDRFSRQTGIPVQFSAKDVPRSLPEDLALCLYRVAQESLRNIGKHAQATQVRVLLASDRAAVTLSIEDTGDGFDRRVKIIFLTMHPDVTYAAEALAAGGSGYVLKNSAGEELLAAIHSVLKGQIYLPKSMAEAVMRALELRPRRLRTAADKLTTRQREVLQLLADGRRVKEIAAALNVSPRTVEFHKYRIMEELGARSTAELARYAVKTGIVT